MMPSERGKEHAQHGERQNEPLPIPEKLLASQHRLGGSQVVVAVVNPNYDNMFGGRRTIFGHLGSGFEIVILRFGIREAGPPDRLVQSPASTEYSARLIGENPSTARNLT